MGHANIQTTMLYVQLAPEDVWHEYARAVAQRVRLSFRKKYCEAIAAHPRPTL